MFASLTVEENLRLVFRQRGGRQCVADSLARAYEAFPVLGQRRGQHGGTLSGGEQRMLSLAKVLVLPLSLLVADEISLGLAPVVIDAVYDGIAEDQSGGHGVAGGRATGGPGPRSGRHGGGARARVGGLQR